jgi:hypothetical protein
MAFYSRACCPLISAPSLTDWHMGGWEHGEQAAWDRGQGGHLPAANEPKKVSCASEKCWGIVQDTVSATL